MCATKFGSTSKRDGKKRLSGYFDEELVALFEQHCLRQNITKTDAIRILLEGAVYGQSRRLTPKGSRKTCYAKVWPQREIRLLIALLIQLTEHLSLGGHRVDSNALKLTVELYSNILIIVKKLEEEECNVR
jgi:hypothetical protein